MTGYQIRIEGELGPGWTDWFGGYAIACEGDGVTLLTCALADQAALHGILRRLRDLGLPLLSVNRVHDAAAFGRRPCAWQDRRHCLERPRPSHGERRISMIDSRMNAGLTGILFILELFRRS